MRAYRSDEVAAKANKWQGRNIVRWRSPEYDALWDASDKELDPAKRAELFIKQNDLVVTKNIIIPVVYRPHTSAVGNKVHARPTGWDSDMSFVAGWWKDA
jgi:peptide/nickel transport system substrate-binding protein